MVGGSFETMSDGLMVAAQEERFLGDEPLPTTQGRKMSLEEEPAFIAQSEMFSSARDFIESSENEIVLRTTD